MQVALGLDSILSRKKKLSKKGFEKMDTYTLDQNVQKVLLAKFFVVLWGNSLCYWIPNNFSLLFKRFRNRIFQTFGPKRLDHFKIKEDYKIPTKSNQDLIVHTEFATI